MAAAAPCGAAAIAAPFAKSSGGKPTAGLGYPWDDFSNLGMGMMRMTSGDDGGAEIYFDRLIDANEPTSQVLGNLGLGSTLASSGRFAEAQAAFEEAAATSTESKFQQAAKFGSATALYGTGDYAAAARAFESPSPIRTAGSAATRASPRRARIAADREAAALRELVETCDPKAPRAAARAAQPRPARHRAQLRATTSPPAGATWEGCVAVLDGGCSLALDPARSSNDAQLTSVQLIAAAIPRVGRAIAARHRARATAEPRRRRARALLVLVVSRRRRSARSRCSGSCARAARAESGAPLRPRTRTAEAVESARSATEQMPRSTMARRRVSSREIRGGAAGARARVVGGV
jgi:hypothetical protein